MENVFFYLIKSSALIAVFLMAYYFLLRKETFFRSNRWFLLFGLVSAVILPLVTFKKTVWIEPLGRDINWQNIPANIVAEPETFEINWLLVVATIYIIGLLLFLVRFAFDFNNLFKVLKGKTVQQQADFKFVDVEEKVSPFSYFNYIVYNSSLYSADELRNILEHEKVHCGQNHTADVLIARIFCIAFWYNPFVWLYKKAILQNLEFIADSEALKNIPDKTAYQFTLLKVTTHDNCVEITNHFYQSLIKKRIVMLNKNQSKKWNSWKYVLIVPALAAFMFYFQVKVIAQEKALNTSDIQNVTAENITIVVDKNTTDEELKNETARAKALGIKLKFSKIRRNANGEIIAIKADYKDQNDKKGTYQVAGDQPIKALRFFKDDKGAIGFGNSKTINIFKHSDDVAEASEVPEAPEEPEALEVPEAPEAPEEPEQPERFKGKKGGISMTVNGENIDIDTDAIFADIDAAFANLDDININIDARELQKISRDALREAREEMRKARPEIAKARLEIRKARPQIERAAREVEMSKPQLEQAKREIEQAREEIRKAKIEIEKQKDEIQKQKTESKK